MSSPHTQLGGTTRDSRKLFKIRAHQKDYKDVVQSRNPHLSSQATRCRLCCIQDWAIFRRKFSPCCAAFGWSSSLGTRC